MEFLSLQEVISLENDIKCDMKSLFFNKTLVSNPNSLPVVKLFCLGLLFTLASSIWIGCSEEPVAPDPPDLVEMSVTVWPQDGATDVDFNVKPTYTFSVELNDELPEISIVRKGDGAIINHNLIKVSSTLYRVEFSQPLAEEETYDRYLSKAIGKNGEVLPKPLPQITSFTTKDVVVIPPLVLSVVSPPNNSEIPDTTSMLHYRADYTLDPATVGPAYTLTNTTSGMQVLAAVNVSGKNISVNVDGLLEHSSAYSAVFDPNVIRGINGEAPATTYSFSFTTEVVTPPPVFTTPEGYLQYAGTYKDGYIYVGGIGPNDEGFTACFDQNGEEVWLETFKINGKYTRVLYIAATQNELYSILEVKSDPGSPGAGEVWLYVQTTDGLYLNKWQRTTGSVSKSITSSETEVYILYIRANLEYIDRFSSNGLVSSISIVNSTDLLFHNGYLYITGGTKSDEAHFISKWQVDLSDSLWYRKKSRAGYLSHAGARLTFASDRLQLLGRISWPEHKTILLQYDESGNLLADLDLSINTGWRDYCSDGVYTYEVGNLLHRIDVNGNTSIMGLVGGYSVFKVDNPSGSGDKMAVTDKTNILKLFE